MPQFEQHLDVVGRLYRNHFTSGAYSLVCEELAEYTPSTIQNAFTQVAVSRHVANAQVFQNLIWLAR